MASVARADVTRLLVIRHGETVWNVEGRVQGYMDSPLTPAGEAQAAALGRRFAGEPPHAVYSSDLGRTRQTVAPLVEATGLDLRLDEGLRERCYGVFEGMTYAEVAERHPQEYERFRNRDPDFAPPGGESARQFRERILAAFDAIATRHRGEDVAVVTHGGVLTVLFREARGVPLGIRTDIPMINASLNVVLRDAASWQIEAWADTAHL